jgi:hypothetical protein
MQNKCPWCRGKFGLVRYYHFRIGFCRKVCRAKYQASWERKKLLRRLIPHRAAIPASSARHRRSQRFADHTALPSCAAGHGRIGRSPDGYRAGRTTYWRREIGGPIVAAFHSTKS